MNLHTTMRLLASGQDWHVLHQVKLSCSTLGVHATLSVSLTSEWLHCWNTLKGIFLCFRRNTWAINEQGQPFTPCSLVATAMIQ